MRLIVISNRLGVTASVNSCGEIVFGQSAGGLASALNSYLATGRYKELGIDDYLWVGWPGMEIAAELRDGVRDKLLKEFKCWPVFLPDDVMDRFYSGFCNRTIWPLFHYFPMLTSYEEQQWECYNDVNNFFALSLAEIIKSDDIIWIHDYQLMLLPELIRERFREAAVGYFHHIPFPSFEIFRLLPGAWRSKLINGLLGSDLAGFHTVDYTHHFLKCVSRIANLDNSLGKISHGGRVTKADTFPIGIEFARFNDSSQQEDVRAEIDKLRSSFAGKKVILSIDRLDYTKGIVNRLDGYRAFLEKHPELREKVILLSVIVPSRVKVAQYQAMKKQTEEMIGEINGKYGSIEWTPVVYQYKSISFAHLAALYTLSEIALVTPLRDGMNLVAKEYAACKKNTDGVLILSEMAGAANELTDAVIMNPNNRESYVEALEKAMNMPYDERRSRLDSMRRRISEYSVCEWAEDFLSGLLAAYKERIELRSKYLTPARAEKLSADYARASKRLIMLDYDGTLVDFCPLPENASPRDELIALLEKLAADEKNDVAVISGRDRYTLEKWLGGVKINLMAEHGAWMKTVNGGWHATGVFNTCWKKEVAGLMRKFAGRLTSSFVEEKDYSVAWHYRACDIELARERANELLETLGPIARREGLGVINGSRVIEVRNAGVNKYCGALNFMESDDFGFTLFAGDDATDEDIFRSISSAAYTIKIGAGQTAAGYSLNEPAELIELLKKLSSTD